MSTWETIAERSKGLPLEQQLQLLAFLDSLTRRRPSRVLKNPAGLWGDLSVDIRPEDIAQARQEMWGSAEVLALKEDSVRLGVETLPVR